jgi:hypothetical protein
MGCQRKPLNLSGLFPGGVHSLDFSPISRREADYVRLVFAVSEDFRSGSQRAFVSRLVLTANALLI